LIGCPSGLRIDLSRADPERPDWVDSGRRSCYRAGPALATALPFRGSSERAFLSSDFFPSTSFAAHSSTTTADLSTRRRRPWSSAGGLAWLLWVFLLSIWRSLVLFLTRRRLREIAPYATAVLPRAGALSYLVDGVLRQPVRDHGDTRRRRAPGPIPSFCIRAMMFHPPMLYSGYTLMASRSRSQIGALVTGRSSARSGSVSRGASRWRHGCFWGSGSCWAARWS